MPTYIRPKVAIIEPGGPNWDALIALLIVAAVVAGVVWFIETFAVVILAVEVAAVVALTAYLVHRLRADGPMWRPAPQASAQPVQRRRVRVIVPAAQPRAVRARTAPRAIEAPKTAAGRALDWAIEEVLAEG